MSQAIPEGVARSGVGTLVIRAEHPDQVRVQADEVTEVDAGGERLIVVRHHNAYVNTGLNNSLDREFGLGGTAVGFIGVSNNNTAVTAATTFLNGASGGAAANTIIKAISPTATRSAQVVTAGATFSNADFTSGVFIWNKLGLLTTSTDAGTGLVDVIGGAGGSSPYQRTFAVDLVSAGTFSVVAQIAVTASAV